MATTTIPIRAAAERLGVHENTIRNWIDRQLVAGYRLPSGVRRIPSSEVERLERELRSVPTSFPEEVVTPAPKASYDDEPPVTSYPKF